MVKIGKKNNGKEKSEKNKNNKEQKEKRNNLRYERNSLISFQSACKSNNF